MSERFSDDERFEVAAAIRDWIHKQPWSECGPGADTCPDWPKAFEIRDVALAALDAAPSKPVEVTDATRERMIEAVMALRLDFDFVLHLEHPWAIDGEGLSRDAAERVVDAARAALGSEEGIR